MKIDTEQINQNLIVRISGEIDHHTSEEIRNVIDRGINHGKTKNIIFLPTSSSFIIMKMVKWLFFLENFIVRMFLLMKIIRIP